MADDNKAREEGDDIETGEAGEDGDEAQKTKPGLLKRLLILAVPAVLLLGAAAGGAVFFLGGSTDSAEAGEDGSLSPAERALAQAHEEHKLSFPEPMLVNINHEGSSSNVLMMNVYFVYDDPAVRAVLESRMPDIMSSYIGFLRELRTEDLVGSSAFHRLRLELLRRANLEIAPARINDVLIKELAVN